MKKPVKILAIAAILGAVSVPFFSTADSSATTSQHLLGCSGKSIGPFHCL